MVPRDRHGFYYYIIMEGEMKKLVASLTIFLFVLAPFIAAAKPPQDKGPNAKAYEHASDEASFKRTDSPSEMKKKDGDASDQKEVKEQENREQKKAVQVEKKKEPSKDKKIKKDSKKSKKNSMKKQESKETHQKKEMHQNKKPEEKVEQSAE